MNNETLTQRIIPEHLATGECTIMLPSLTYAHFGFVEQVYSRKYSVTYNVYDRKKMEERERKNQGESEKTPLEIDRKLTCHIELLSSKKEELGDRFIPYMDKRNINLIAFIMVIEGILSPYKEYCSWTEPDYYIATEPIKAKKVHY